MRCPIRTDADREDAARLNAEPWMLELLEINPSYPHWGPHEDYMWADDVGWRSRVMLDSWSEMGFDLDDLNEVVHFYFSVTRDSEDCEACGGNGYHPDAQEVVNSFYRHMNPARDEWCASITEDEVDALWEASRLQADFTEKPTADEVNAWQRGKGLGHDGINRWILTTQRLKRLGLPEACPTCDQHGYVYTADVAHVSLTLWFLHPRKGASRGVEVATIQRDELPEVFAYLAEAADRNAERFARVPRAALDGDE